MKTLKNWRRNGGKSAVDSAWIALTIATEKKDEQSVINYGQLKLVQVQKPTNHFNTDSANVKSLDLGADILRHACFRHAHMRAATCQCFGCTVKPFIHTPVLFQGEDLQHKHSNVSQNTLLFSDTCIHHLWVWICVGGLCWGYGEAHLVINQQRPHFPSFLLILLYFLIYAACLGSVENNSTKNWLTVFFAML